MKYELPAPGVTCTFRGTLGVVVCAACTVVWVTVVPVRDT